MALKDDLQKEVSRIFGEVWEITEGEVIPEPENVKLSNHTVHFARATVLYADLSGSTKMVDKKTWQFSAEIYRTYLYCAARIIRDQGGDITAYDGDRIMAVFNGGSQSTNATRCAFKFNWTVKNLINPSIKKQYNSDFAIRHVVGIDTSEIHVARTGVRGDNDLVWVGRAANYAAKLTELDADYPTWITNDVFEHLHEDQKYGGDPRRLMWEPMVWNAMGGMSIHRSTWWRPL